MAEHTKIEWCDHTWNPWRGCTKVSPGCQHCYADTMSRRNPGVLGVWGPYGTRVVASEAQWKLPLKWNAAAARDGVRRRVFCASLADVFEDWKGTMSSPGGKAMRRSGSGFAESDLRIGRDIITMDDVRRRLFATIYRTPHLDWLLLTKRPENARRFLTDPYLLGRIQDAHVLAERPREPTYLWWEDTAPAWPWPNVWLGVSVEDQQRADERIPELLKVPAAVRFLSCEPLLGPVNLLGTADAQTYWLSGPLDHPEERTIDWIIVGGESGPNARPCHVEWVRSLVWQCQVTAVACFVKQLGRSYYQDGPGGDRVRVVLEDPKGGDLAEWPADLRVREFPGVTP